MKALIKLLLLEDNPGDARLINEILKESISVNFYLEHVDHLKDALNLLKSELPDAILLDLGLPDSQGLNSLESIISQTPNLPVIVLTGTNDLEMAVKAVQVGAQDYLTKGDIDGSLLVRVIRYAIERKQMENKVRKSETDLIKAQHIAHVGNWTWHIQSDHLEWSDELFRIFGLNPNEYIWNLRDFMMRSIHPDDVDFFIQSNFSVIEQKKPLPVEFRIIRPDGHQRFLWSEAGEILYDESGNPAVLKGIIQDITERKEAEQRIVKNLDRLRSLYEITQYDAKNIQDLLDFSLNAAIQLAESKIGYIYFYDETTQKFTLNTWSKDVFHGCSVVEPQTVYMLEKTGFWGEAVRQRRPIINNDFEAYHPDKRGYPEGHIKLTKFLTVPVFANQSIVAVVGVANKQTDYDESDVYQLSLLMDSVWKMVERKIAQEAALESAQLAQAITNSLTSQIAVIDLQGYITAVNQTWIDFALENGNSDLSKIGVGTNYLSICAKASGPHSAGADEVGIGIREVLNGKRATFSWEYACHSPQEERWFIMRVTNLESQKKGAVIAHLDITDRKHHEREQAAIIALADAMRTVNDRAQLLNIIADQFSKLIDLNGISIALWIHHLDNFSIEASKGIWAENKGVVYQPGSQGVCRRVFAFKKPVIFSSKNPSKDFEWPSFFKGANYAVCLALVASNENIGVLWVARDREFNEREVQLLSTFADMAANAIHRTILFELNERRFAGLSALRRIDLAILENIGKKEILNIILSEAIKELGVDAADVILYNPSNDQVEVPAGIGFFDRFAENNSDIPIQMRDNCVLNWQNKVQIPNLLDFPDFITMRKFEQENFISYCSAPIEFKGKVVGALELFSRSSHTLDPIEMDFMLALAGQAAIALDNVTMYGALMDKTEELVNAYNATIEGWSRTLDLRDEDTEGHTQRVTQIAVKLAAMLGLSESEIVKIRWGSLLHDIGKMGIPDSILLKNGPLSDEESIIMRKHPDYAYQLLSPILFLKEAVDVPYCHHEKWDGTGYPRQLMGEDIPLYGRIFALADVWDALTSDRPYRKAWSHQQALDYISDQAGKHFDPVITNLFLEMIKSGSFQ
jgi:PAS domain S-box-containing protein